MSYTITPYKRDGVGELSTSGSSTTTECDAARGFRNVAVGATLYSNSLTRTVASKTDEDTVVVSSAWDLSDEYTWEYINPTITFSGIYYIKHTKNDRPLTTMGIPTKDSDWTFCTLGKGVSREIVLSGFIESATVADIYKDATILESLADGSQTYQGTCTFTEDVPPRTSYVYVTSVNWQYNRDKPKWLDIMVNMTECQNRGST